jgi:pimeloyl-ACP methyl ester carboxylesterase
MEVARFARPGDPTGRSLVVMLPGAHIQRRDFDSEGFIPALRQRFPLADAVASGLDLADYVEPDFPAQLHDGVIAPALRQGYAHISLVGISLGGMGALLYAAAYPDHAGNIILIAPFLATRRTIAVVTMAGGLAAWDGSRCPGRHRARSSCLVEITGLRGDDPAASHSRLREGRPFRRGEHDIGSSGALRALDRHCRRSQLDDVAATLAANTG